MKHTYNDYLATEPNATEWLCRLEKMHCDIWECACGEGHISKVLQRHGYRVRSTDMIDRGFGEVENFLYCYDKWYGDIVTNPPFKEAQRFVEKALSLVSEGRKVIMFIKLQFLESQARRMFFRMHPPKVVYISCSRLRCAKNGRFDVDDNADFLPYAWFVWEKGFKGDPVIKWFN